MPQNEGSFAIFDYLCFPLSCVSCGPYTTICGNFSTVLLRRQRDRGDGG